MFITRRHHAADILPLPLPRELLLQLDGPLEPSTQLAHDAFLLNIFSVAALSWLAYDMVLNFNREIMLVWKRWHEPKGRHSRRIYMVVRYFSLLNLAWYVGVNTSTSLSLNFCRAWYYIVVVNTAIISLLPDVMLLIRVNSVYGWNIRTLLFTSFMFMTQLATSLVVGILSVTSASAPAPSPSPFIPGCPTSLRKSIAQFTLVAWVPSILAHATYLLLMLNTLAHLMRGLGPDESASPPSASPSPSTETSYQNSIAHSGHLASDSNPNLADSDNIGDMSSHGHSEFSMSTLSHCHKPDAVSGGRGNKLKKKRSGNFKGKARAREEDEEGEQVSPAHLTNPNPTTTTKGTSPYLRHNHRNNRSKADCVLCSPHIKAVFSWTALQQVRRLVPTMMVFLGHGWLYFGFAICAKIVNAIVVTTQSGPLQAAAIPLTMALLPILVTRIYLSMVEYLHYGLQMQRPRLLASYDGERYVGFEGDEYEDIAFGEQEDGEEFEEEEEGEEEYGGDLELAESAHAADSADSGAGKRSKDSAGFLSCSRSRGRLGANERTRRTRPSGRRRRRGGGGAGRGGGGGSSSIGRMTFAARDSGSLASLAIRASLSMPGPGIRNSSSRTFSYTHSSSGSSQSRSQSLQMSAEGQGQGPMPGGVVLDFRDEEY